GEIVATWTFLNVFGGPLHLHAFTLDDYIDALRYQETDFPCELVTETHCALLKALVPETAPECFVALPSLHQHAKGKNRVVAGSDCIEVKQEEDENASDPETISVRSHEPPSTFAILLELRASASKSGGMS